MTTSGFDEIDAHLSQEILKRSPTRPFIVVEFIILIDNHYDGLAIAIRPPATIAVKLIEFHVHGFQLFPL